MRWRVGADGDLDLDATGDVYIGANGDLAVATGLAAVASGITAAIRLFMGEWFADASAGHPWFQTTLGVKNPDLNLVRQQLRKTILGVPNVLSISRLDVTFDPSTRVMTVNWQALSDIGQTPYTTTGILVPL